MARSNNKHKFTLKSEKYKEQMLPIKRQLMKEIASYFVNGEFSMNKETVIPYQLTFGNFDARFDTIDGNEKKFKLYLKERSFMPATRLDVDDNTTIEKEIPFLMTLLDYVDMDNRKVKI